MQALVEARPGLEFRAVISNRPEAKGLTWAASQGIATRALDHKAHPTREGMVAALDGMDNYNLGGYVVGFKPGVRSGSRFVELSIISGAGKIRQ